MRHGISQFPSYNKSSDNFCWKDTIANKNKGSAETDPYAIGMIIIFKVADLLPQVSYRLRYIRIS